MKQINIPEMRSSVGEQRALTELLLKYGYTHLTDELKKLILIQRSTHGLTWNEIEESHKIDRRSLIKIKKT